MNKKFDLRLSRKEVFSIKKSLVLLNYVEDEKIYAAPLKNILENSGYIWNRLEIEKDEYDADVTAADIVLNVVTDKFIADKRARRILEAAYRNDVRRVSLIFSENEKVNDKLQERYGDVVEFDSIDQELEEYLLSSLYYQEPFKSNLGRVDNPVSGVLTPLLKGLIIPPELEIGDSDTVIFAVGSMGYSTIRLWMQEFQLNARIVVIHKNPKIRFSQPDIKGVDNYYNVRIAKEEEESGKDFLDGLRVQLKEIIKKNVKSGQRLVILGGLGKSTGSFVIPHLNTISKLMGIKTITICSLPFKYESKTSREIADNSLEIIRRLSDKTYIFDSMDERQFKAEPKMNMEDYFRLVGYGLALAVNDKDMEPEEEYKVLITEKKRIVRKRSSKSSSCGRYNVEIVGC